MTPEYLAGFFDGEGCIDCQRMYPKEGKGKLYVRPRIRVSQTASSRIVLDKLQATFGGHLYHRKSKKNSERDSISWEILDTAGMKRMLEMMLPHLIGKAEQAKLVLWWFDNASGLHQRSNLRPNLEVARTLFQEELKAMKRDPARLSSEATVTLGKLLV